METTALWNRRNPGRATENHRKWRERLGSGYVRQILRNKFGKTAIITDQLLELKRIQIQLMRAIRKVKTRTP